ncbi:splicing factor, proline- and glutamine-rich-like [Capricornis sumatraensis]|uniref:splicing factor, proline- and glutamine-rich-like n=1 Tax=Capricornis sumatraensis TaxID=34865 RepID=UPI003604C7BB
MGEAGEWPAGLAGRRVLRPNPRPRSAGRRVRAGGYGAAWPQQVRDPGRGTGDPGVTQLASPGATLPSSPPPPTAHPGREPGARPRTSGAPPPPPAAPGPRFPPQPRPPVFGPLTCLAGLLSPGRRRPRPLPPPPTPPPPGDGGPSGHAPPPRRASGPGEGAGGGRGGGRGGRGPHPPRGPGLAIRRAPPLAPRPPRPS